MISKRTSGGNEKAYNDVNLLRLIYQATEFAAVQLLH